MKLPSALGNLFGQKQEKKEVFASLLLDVEYVAAALWEMGEKETPNMGHLKGSGGIGEAADVIFLFDNLYRRTKKEDDKNKVDIYIEQRHGDSGLAHLWSDLGSCRFGNLAEKNLMEEYQKSNIGEENIF